MHITEGGEAGEDSAEEKEDAENAVNLGAMMIQVLAVVKNHAVKLRSDVAMTLVTLSVLEGLVTQLDPDFDMVRHSIPHLDRL